MSAAVQEQQKPEIFPSVNYFDRRVVGANVKRWAFFAGDLIVPQRKAEISWLAIGGEETPNPCLQKYGRGFVPRGRAALLELGGEPIPMRHLGDLQSVAWTGIPLNEDAVKNRFGFVPVYPGDGLKVLRRYSLNDGGMRKGIDEISALQGKKWEECHDEDGTGILDVIELAQFGDGISKTLRGLEDQIKFAEVRDSRIDYGQFRADQLRMCNEFRGWASRKVAEEHGLLKTGHVGEWQGGWSYSYSPVTEMLLEQLEIPRQDQPLQEMSRMIGQMNREPAPSAGISAVDMELIDRRFEEKLELKLSAASQRIAELEAQLAAKPETEVEIKTYICEHCGEEVKVAGKGFHVGRHCRVLHPKTETE